MGHIIDGIFDGVIHSRQSVFHVERAHKFFSDPQGFHSIIYHEDDVQPPNLIPSCNVKEKLIEHLNYLAKHAVPLNDYKNRVYGADRHARLKRQTINNNRFCPIRVAADHLFLQNVGGGSVMNTMSEIVAVIGEVQQIYRNTDFFNNDGVPDSVQPVVASLEVLNQSAPGYRYGTPSISVNNFLDLWSQENQSGFCLSLLLTYRDFSSGVIGLAWVAQPPGGTRDGICEDEVRLSVGNRYLNTAIVSFLNFGRRQPRSVSTITVAHELGHSFGSPVSNTGIIMFISLSMHADFDPEVRKMHPVYFFCLKLTSTYPWSRIFKYLENCTG